MKFKILFEIMASLLLFLSSVLFYFEITSKCFFEIVLLINIFRFLMIFFERDPFRLFMHNLFRFIPYIKEIFIMIFCIYFFFALLGMHFFGGKLRNDTKLEYNGNSYSELYKYSNFNDMPSSFLILFSLMIINNWNNQVKIKFKIYLTFELQVDVHVIATGSEYTRIFFALFYFFSVILCLNILLAIILEFITSKWLVNLNSNRSSTEKEEIKQQNIHLDFDSFRLKKDPPLAVENNINSNDTKEKEIELDDDDDEEKKDGQIN